MHIRGKDNANRIHYEAGIAVRRTMQEFGNTMPEDLPTPDSIKTLERQEKKRLAKPESTPSDTDQDMQH